MATMMRGCNLCCLCAFVIMIGIVQFQGFGLSQYSLEHDLATITSREETKSRSTTYKNSDDDIPIHRTQSSSRSQSSPLPSSLRSTSTTFITKHHSYDPMKKQQSSTGYRPIGGDVPVHAADYLASPRMWKYVDNTTCLMDNTDHKQTHHHRVPHAIILGAMKAGTHALTTTLREHPDVANSRYMELHFFDDSQKAQRSEHGIPQTSNQQAYADIIQRLFPTIPLMVDKNSTTTTTLPLETREEQPKIIVSSPDYLLQSDRVPDLLVCVVPWTKWMALLRNPIDRVSSHYRFLNEAKRANDKAMVDWDTWMDHDIRLLTEAGVLNATNVEERAMAWKRYQRRPHSQQIVGRGLYLFQIEDYYRVMDRVKKPRSDLHLIQSERFRTHRQDEYDKLLPHLGLPPHRLDASLQNDAVVIHPTNTTETIPMPPHIRQKLKELYKPFNEQLYELLKWDHVWDDE